MATLRVSNLRGRSNGQSPSLPDGAVVTGVTTTGSAIVGAAVTINVSGVDAGAGIITACLLYTSPSPRDRTRSRMPSSA